VSVRLNLIIVAVMAAATPPERFVVRAHALVVVEDLAAVAVRVVVIIVVGATTSLECGFGVRSRGCHHRHEEEGDKGLNEGSDLHCRRFKNRESLCKI